ncbi:hypothetical protein JCM10449v2_001702 [Rhodotorula kratochvilovae]
MDHSRTDANLLAPRGLGRLPEELVDLVCSFVRDFEVDDTVTTLGSLCLTSRQFLTPAHRALLYDPSLVLAERDVEHAHLILHRILMRPELGQHVKRLEGLVELRPLDFGPPPIFANWAISLLRCCPNLEAVVVWPDLVTGWLSELAKLPRLRHLIVQVRCEDDEWLTGSPDPLPAFLASLNLDQLESLTLRHFNCPVSTPAPLRLPVVRLCLEQYAVADSDSAPDHHIGLDLCDVRRLTLRPSFNAMSVFPAGLPVRLETFILHPIFTSFARSYYPWVRWPAFEWRDMFIASSTLSNLTIIILKEVTVDLATFQLITSLARNLHRIEFRDSDWDEQEWTYMSQSSNPSPDDHLVNALGYVPNLRFLHLGAIPTRFAQDIHETQTHCMLHGIELEWRLRLEVA